MDVKEKSKEYRHAALLFINMLDNDAIHHLMFDATSTEEFRQILKNNVKKIFK